MPKVTIDGKTVEVPEGTNLVDAADAAGIEIPHYCYHPGLSVSGNCRMCLVEILALSEQQSKPLPKLQIACNTTVQDGMVVEVGNEKVEAARRSVLEFLLINHPIDCPICDQAGECKLQEYYMDYGRYGSRVPLEDKVNKAKVIPVGPSIMLDQERCILCTRCVRFLEEVPGTHELCLKERGDRTELALAEGKWVDNDYAENIVDICPVGALTSRAFRFNARVWYLQSTPSVCTGCATGCNIDVHSRDRSIFRVKPRANPDVNGYWMCDYGRGIHAGNSGPERLQTSLSRQHDAFVECRMEEAGLRAAAGLQAAGSTAVVASAGLSLEEAFLAAELAKETGQGPLMMISPETSDTAADDLLISEDRYPNRAGMRALGYVEASSPTGIDGGALILRCDPAADGEAWMSLLENLASTIVLSDALDETAAYADHVLAIGSHFEGAGSFMNKDGRVQPFQAAVPPPGGAVEGWAALAYLLDKVGGRRFADFDSVSAATAEALRAAPRAA